MSSIASCVREIDPLSLALSLGVRERDVIFSMFLEPELIVAHLTNVPGFSIDIVKRRIKVKKIWLVISVCIIFHFSFIFIPSLYLPIIHIVMWQQCIPLHTQQGFYGLVFHILVKL